MYQTTGIPQPGTKGVSKQVRDEFALIAAAFEKLLNPTNAPGAWVRIDNSGQAYVAATDGDLADALRGAIGGEPMLASQVGQSIAPLVDGKVPDQYLPPPPAQSPSPSPTPAPGALPLTGGTITGQLEVLGQVHANGGAQFRHDTPGGLYDVARFRNQSDTPGTEVGFVLTPGATEPKSARISAYQDAGGGVALRFWTRDHNGQIGARLAIEPDGTLRDGLGVELARGSATYNVNGAVTISDRRLRGRTIVQGTAGTVTIASGVFQSGDELAILSGSSTSFAVTTQGATMRIGAGTSVVGTPSRVLSFNGEMRMRWLSPTLISVKGDGF
jgi:hypothetical protein